MYECCNKYVVYKLVIVEFNLTECENLSGNLTFKNFPHFRMNNHRLNEHKNNFIKFFFTRIKIKINILTLNL